MMDTPENKQADRQVETTRYNSQVGALSDWLDKTTSLEWAQMKIIRTRLQRLEKEKKALMQSQSAVDGDLNKSFKVRKMSRH